MKRRKFLANTSFALAGLSTPMGLAAMAAPSAVLDANQTEMLAAFHLTLTEYPGPEELKNRLTSVASIEYTDATTLRFRSLSGERLELSRTGGRVIARSLA